MMVTYTLARETVIVAQRTGECRPGMYAIEVVGELPQEVLEFLEEKRIPFHCKPPESTK